MSFSGHYCWCGREAKVLNPRCEKHIHKDPPKSKTKKKFSGYSAWREDQGRFQALEGR